MMDSSQNGTFSRVLATYLLVQLGRMDLRRPAYSATNATGAILILVSLLHDFNLSSFVIEIAWLLISLYGLTRWLRDRNATESSA